MHLGDSIFIFVLALILFGPKKLPEMARQIGKLMAEFRRASNDFRLQIDEELRTMERQEQLATQQKKQEAEQAGRVSPAAEPGILLPALGAGDTPGAPALTGSLQVLPPNLGEQVSAGSPYAVSAPEVEDHQLLHVESIPVDPDAAPDQPTGPAAAAANAALLQHHGSAPLVASAETTHDTEQPLHHG